MTNRNVDSASCAIGILIGGTGSRLGGVAKGLLCDTEGVPLVSRLQTRAQQALPISPLLLVGKHPAYAHLRLPRIEDDPKESGPLGGLRALLVWAQHKHLSRVVALACDMPRVPAELLSRLVTHVTNRAAVAPQREGRWEPLCAVYEVARCLPVVEQLLSEGRRGLHHVLTRVQASSLPLGKLEEHWLDDWDTPTDLTRRP